MSKVKFTKSFGMWLLAIWLIVTGLEGLVHLSFTGLSVIMGILAIAAGVLIIFGR